VIVRNLGPAGKGIPIGGTTGQILVKDSSTNYDTHWANPPDGTDAIVGPASSISNNIALFDGTTGKLLKDSTFALSNYATVAAVALKEPAVAGKGLSENDFTDILKTKLDALNPAGFRGSFPLESDITSILSPLAGDYAYLEVLGDDVVTYLFDETNDIWTPLVVDAVDMTGSEIAAVLFDSGEAWDQNDCLIYSPTERAMLQSHDTVITTFLGGGAGYQPQDASLTAFAGLVNLADRLPYFTGVDVMATVTFGATGRNLVSAATVADQRTILGIGTTDVVQIAGLAITSGSTARAGDTTLVAGTKTIANTTINANHRIFVSRKTAGGTVGAGGYGYSLNIGVGFTINSVDLTGTLVNTDTSIISYFIVEII